jgi:hypothetical protein
MYLDGLGDRRCRLVLRGCVEPLRRPTVAKRVGLTVEGPIDFIMEQRMLRTIKRLSEGSGRPGVA